MGVYVHYQAVPADGELFRRLRDDPQFCVLYKMLLHRPCGPFDTRRLDADEVEELLNDIAGEEVFGSRAAVDRMMAELHRELAAATIAHPGLEQRAVYIKSNCDFDRHLERALQAQGHPSAGTLVSDLIFGNVAFEWGDGELTYVPTATVAEAARWFGPIDPASFGRLGDDFRAFRDLYVAAAGWGEVVVAGCG
jgi:hypothetical protein